jgi:hypothetical protein
VCAGHAESSADARGSQRWRRGVLGALRVCSCRRSQQVEDLLRQCPGCRPVNPDRCVSVLAGVRALHQCCAASRRQQTVQPRTPFSCAQSNPSSCMHCRTVLDLPVELKDGQATALRITLPPHFPQVSACAVVAHAQHACTDHTALQRAAPAARAPLRRLAAELTILKLSCCRSGRR